MSVKGKNTRLIFLKPDYESELRIPYSHSGVSAGFPSPALDFMETPIDLNRALSENPLATFYVRVEGNSMMDAGIQDKDILVVDRSLEPGNNSIAICFVDGDFTVKRIRLEKECLWLLPENPEYQPIRITEDTSFSVWGIVTYVIKKIN